MFDSEINNKFHHHRLCSCRPIIIVGKMHVPVEYSRPDITRTIRELVPIMDSVTLAPSYGYWAYVPRATVMGAPVRAVSTLSHAVCVTVMYH